MAGVITALVSQKKNSHRINVFIDEQFAFSLSRLVAAWLKVGQFLSDEKIAQLIQDDTREKALQSALRLIGIRSRSEAELRERLLSKGYSDEIVESVILRLKQNELLGDENFARLWMEQRQSFRQKSRRVIAMELRQKGVADEIIQEVLAESSQDDQVAYIAGKKYLRKVINLEKKDFFQRLMGYLVRKGFSYAISRDVTERLWSEVSASSSKLNGREEFKTWDNLDG